MIASRFSVVGFLVGLLLALLIVFVGPDILSFNHARLFYGVVAIIVWVLFTFNVGGPGYGRREL